MEPQSTNCKTFSKGKTNSSSSEKLVKANEMPRNRNEVTAEKKVVISGLRFIATSGKE
jgi:hypothetical protein